jgi:hypothetical protein
MNPIKEEFLKVSTTENMLEFAQLVGMIEKSGLLIEVVYTALKQIKSNPKTSPLLALQIAAEDWDC